MITSIPLRRITLSNANAGPVGRFNPRSPCERCPAVFRNYSPGDVCTFSQCRDIFGRKRSGRRGGIGEFTQSNFAEIILTQCFVCTHLIGQLNDFKSELGWHLSLRRHGVPHSRAVRPSIPKRRFVVFWAT